MPASVLTHVPNGSLICRKDSSLSAIELINKYGYTVEQHIDVETQDGYLLELHRIPYGKSDKNVETKRPALLILHGLLSSSQDFVNNGVDSLAFLSVDRGYDVWLGNARGNKFCVKHRYLNPKKDRKFWEFSWHEIGIHDVPTMINYILKKTDSTQLYYIGHSQGSTALTVLLSEYPEYNNKIKCAIMLGPAIFLGDSSCTLNRLGAFHQRIARIVFRVLNMDPRILHDNFLIKMFTNKVTMSILPVWFYMWIYESLLGKTNQLDVNKIPIIFASAPAGCSTQQLEHFGQSLRSGSFRKFDFGPQENLTLYGNVVPPEYNIGNFKTPTFIHCGMTDAQVGYEGILILKDKLPNLIGFHTVPSEQFNHVDFLWANNVVSVLYEPIFRNLEEF